MNNRIILIFVVFPGLIVLGTSPTNIDQTDLLYEVNRFMRELERHQNMMNSKIEFVSKELHRHSYEIQMQKKLIYEQNKEIEKLRIQLNKYVVSASSSEENVPIMYTYASFGCVGDEIHLSCSSGKTIFVSSAEYGQYSQSCEADCCGPHPYDCTESMAENNADEWLLLKIYCDNKTSCIYLFQGSSFIDECSISEPVDYLSINYQCLPENLDEPVGFTAYATETRLYEGNNLVIFDGLISNIGSYYNANSSTFICPHDGVYMFSLTLYGSAGALVKAKITSDRSGSLAGVDTTVNASNMAIYHCLKGEKIWVRAYGSYSEVFGSTNLLSTFSGYVLHYY